MRLSINVILETIFIILETILEKIFENSWIYFRVKILFPEKRLGTRLYAQ